MQFNSRLESVADCALRCADDVVVRVSRRSTGQYLAFEIEGSVHESNNPEEFELLRTLLEEWMQRIKR